MLIIWGRRVIKRKLGRVADYCNVCGDARPFRVTEHRSVPHLYFIPLARSRIEGHTRSCESCKRELGADPADYRAFVRDRKASLEDLCDRTNPSLPDAIARRLDARDRIAAGTATDVERLQAIFETLGVEALRIEARAAQTHLDRWTALAAMLMVSLPIILGFACYPWLGDEAAMWVGFGVFLVGAAATILVAIDDVRRFYARKVEPDLVARLGHVQPTPEELEAGRDWLRANELKLHRRIDPVRLSDRIRAAAASPPPAVHFSR